MSGPAGPQRIFTVKFPAFRSIGTISAKPAGEIGKPIDHATCSGGVLGKKWISAFFIAGLLIPQLVLAQCVKDSREVRFQDGSAKIRSYLCRVGDDAKPGLRIEFHRLSETAAGNILMGEPDSDLDLILGKPIVVKNAVYEEALSLFESFGTKSVEAECNGIAVDVPAGQKSYSDQSCGKSQSKTLWHLADLDYGTDAFGFGGFPLPIDENTILKTNGWPTDYNFFYDPTLCENEFPIGCTYIWKYLTKPVLKDYEANSEIENKNIAKPAADEENADATEKGDSVQYIPLLRHLTKGGLPQDFLTIVGNPPGCGTIAFQIDQRHMILDNVTFENVSSKALRFGRLIGAETNDLTLRSAALLAEKGSDASDVKIPEFELKPGERALVPLKINFVVSNSMKNTFVDLAKAQGAFQRIQASSHKVFSAIQSGSEGQDIKIQKSRGSFGKPSIPAMTPYVYGPEIAFKGFTVDNHEIIPDGTLRNFLALTVGTEGGSCPHLYAWDIARNAWARYRKVIHKGNGQSHEMTEEVRLNSFTTRLRLAEKKLELAALNSVALRLDLKNKTSILLYAPLPALRRSDDRYVRLYAGDIIDLQFEPPKWLDPRDVEETTAIVSGYYDPYSRIRLSRQETGN